MGRGGVGATYSKWGPAPPPTLIIQVRDLFPKQNVLTKFNELMFILINSTNLTIERIGCFLYNLSVQLSWK